MPLSSTPQPPSVPREVQIAVVLLGEAITTSDPLTLKRLAHAAKMHLENLHGQ